MGGLTTPINEAARILRKFERRLKTLFHTKKVASNSKFSANSPLASPKRDSKFAPKSPLSNSRFAPKSPLGSKQLLMKAAPFLPKKKSGEGEKSESGLWQREILMGEKCQPLDFSGVIYYDKDGISLPGLPPRSPRGSHTPVQSFSFPSA